MQFEESHRFDKPAATVLRMFTDKDYFVRKYQELGFSGVEVLAHEDDGDHFEITVRYEAPSDAPVPGFAKKFLRERNTVTQTDRWDRGTMRGSIDAEIQGLPAKIHADMTLTDDGEGAVNRIVWRIDCGIPLVGGKIAKLIAEDIQTKSRRDQAKSRELLENY